MTPVTLPPAGTWTSASLDISLRRSFLLGTAAWQLVVILAAAADHPQPWLPVLVAAHLVTAAVALAALSRRWLLGPVVVAAETAFLLDCLAAPSIDSTLVLAACWLGDLLNVLSAAFWRGRASWIVPILGVTTVALALVVLRSGWPVTLSASFVVTTLAMVAATRLGLPQVRRLAEWADHEAERAEADRQAVLVATTAAREAAEDARVLHDTVINTLGAIANGGAAVRDVAAVRERCRRDVATMTGLLAGRAVATGTSLAEAVARPVGIRVRRTGLDDAELRRHEALLSIEAGRALAASAGELVLNAAKHSGADEVVVDVGQDGAGLRVTVSDDGVGFSGVVIAGRGLAESVVARLEAVGGGVRIRSRPGEGTRIELTCGPAATSPEPETERDRDDAATVAARIRRRACWILAAATVGVGFVIEAGNRPGRLTATYGMLVLTGALVALAWRVCRDGRLLPRWLTALIVLGVPCGFLLALAGVGFGTDDVSSYQAIGFVPLLMLLHALTPRRRALTAGSIVFGVTVAATAVVLGLRHTGATAVLVLVAAAPAAGLVAAWVGFSRLVERLVATSYAARHEAFRARAETAERQAVLAARARWRRAEVHSSRELLDGVETGRLDPRAADVQAACAEEEAYLRQLILLSPEAYRMNAWLARALAEARSGAVRLVVRTGEVDAPDDVVARMLGTTVLDAVRAMPPDSDLVVGLFGTRSGPRCTLVGAGACFHSRAQGWQERLDSRVAVERCGDQSLVEIAW